MLIQDWDTAGLVFLDYILVIEMVDKIQQVGLSRVPHLPHDDRHSL